MTRRGSRESTASERLAGKHVLVVEDDGDNQKIISMMLGGKGAIATAVTDAGELRIFLQAVAEEQRERPDAVILDWNLAGADAEALIDEIRRSAPGLERRILVVTGDISRRERSRSASRGDDPGHHGPPVLLKPFSAADLLESLSELLERPDQG